MTVSTYPYYRSASVIPEDIWRTHPAATNGNEQVHCNVNCDDVDFTLLGGVITGRLGAFDDRVTV